MLKVENIFNKPMHPYTQGLFKAFKREGSKGHLITIKGNVPSFTNYPQGCPFNSRCPYVFDKCLKGEVPPFEIEVDHSARCWLYEK